MWSCHISDTQDQECTGHRGRAASSFDNKCHVSEHIWADSELHSFCWYSLEPGCVDKLFKIGPVLDAFKKTFHSVINPESFQSQIIKGHLSIKQYILKKKSWGLKVWVREGTSGYMYRFGVYQGSAGGGQVSQLGMAAGVFMCLCDWKYSKRITRCFFFFFWQFLLHYSTHSGIATAGHLWHWHMRNQQAPGSTTETEEWKATQRRKWSLLCCQQCWKHYCHRLVGWPLPALASPHLIWSRHGARKM